MIHIVVLGLILLIGGISLLHAIKKQSRKQAEYTGKIVVIAIIGYILAFGNFASTYVKDTRHVETHKESVTVADLSKEPVKFAEHNIRVRLGRVEGNGETYYVVSVPERGMVKIPVEGTRIIPRPHGALMRVRYTRVKDNWATEFFTVANRIQGDKYTLYIAPGSVDLSTKPDTELYPTYVKSFK